MLAFMSACEMDGCQDEATHTVLIVPAGGDEEIWEVCRSHDRELKRAFVGGVPRLTPPPDSPVVVQCSECGQLLAEAGPPCPNCGSLDRAIAVGDTAGAHDAIQVRSKHLGKGGWQREVKAGDSFTRDLDAWGRRELVIDRAGGQYREVIELYEGSRLESSAKLRDHWG